MRIIAAILNQVLLLLGCGACVAFGTKHSKQETSFVWILLLPLGLLPIVFNIVLASEIGRAGRERVGKTGNWLSLYMKRRALEEQAKIDSLHERSTSKV